TTAVTEEVLVDVEAGSDRTVLGDVLFHRCGVVGQTLPRRRLAEVIRPVSVDTAGLIAGRVGEVVLKRDPFVTGRVERRLRQPATATGSSRGGAPAVEHLCRGEIHRQ